MTSRSILLVETKAQGQVTTPNVQRKLKAATSWCERINALPPGEHGDLPWHYVLLGESQFHDWRNKGARLADLLAFARVRPLALAATQGNPPLIRATNSRRFAQAADRSSFHCSSASRTATTTGAQPAPGGWRKRRIDPGYQGESLRPLSQRQSQR